MSTSSQRFASRWSALTWCVTVLVTAILAVVTVAVALELGRLEPDDKAGRVWLMGALLIAPSILIFAALFAPLGYELTSSGVVVRRLGPNIRIAYDEVTKIVRLERRDLGFAVRTWGSGGLFGFYGRFWSRPLRSFRMYATNAADLVLITTRSGSKFVLTPNDADYFADSLRDAAARGAEPFGRPDV